MKKIFLTLSAVLMFFSTLHAATEQPWYNDVASITNNGQYYIFSVGGNGFMKAGSATVMTATKDEKPSLFTITKADKGYVSSGGKYLRSFMSADAGPIYSSNSENGCTIVWTSMSNNSYWNIHGSYDYLGQRYAGLYYKNDKYTAEIPSGSILTGGFSTTKDTQTGTEYRWYLVSEEQYDRHWAIYDYDAYKETLDITQFKTTVYKDVYAALETAYNKTFDVKNDEHSAEVVNAAKQALENAYAAAEAYPAKYEAAKKAFDDALAATKAFDKKDITDAVYAKLHKYDEVNYDVVNTSLETINAATQALKDAVALAETIKEAYANALAVINELDGLKDKGENAIDLQNINNDIATARVDLEKAETIEAINATVTAPKLKKIDPITFNKTTFNALESVATAASSAQGQEITYTSAAPTIVNDDMIALREGTVKLTARTAGNDNYYPFERSATITVNAITTYGTVNGSVCEGSMFPYEGQEYAAREEEYTVTLKNRNRTGGDSIVTLTVSTKPVFKDIKDGKAICPSELANFRWEGEEFAENDLVKTKTLTSKLYQCDSTVTFTLTLLPTYDIKDGITICPSALPYTWKGTDGQGINFSETFTTDDVENNNLTRIKHLKTINGCDSTVTFTLTVKQVFETTAQAKICSSELPYTWTGEDANGAFAMTFQKAESRDTTLTSSVGCDSIVTFTLTVLPAYKDIQDGTTICESKLPYTWISEDANGTFAMTFQKAESRDTTLTSSVGCDSVVTFTLTVLPVYKDIQDGTTICDNELANFRWEGEQFTMDELVKTKTLKTINNCDSIVTFTLTVNKTYRFEESMTIYQGENKSWRNIKLSGYPVSDPQHIEINDTYQTITTNCDSTYVLYLTVKERPTTYFDTTVYVCGSEAVEFIDDTYDAGEDGEEEYTIIQKNANVFGGDSIITLKVVALPTYNQTQEDTITYGDTYKRGEEELTLNAGTYTFTDSLLTVSECDSVIVTTLVVEKAAQTIEWTIDTVSITVQDTLILKAQASSGLPVTYTVSDETLASVKDNVLTALEAGELTITATQEGDDNYLPAEPVEQQLLIEVETALIETEMHTDKTRKLIYNGQLIIIRNGHIYNAEGRRIY